jgi:hypothetical protein
MADLLQQMAADLYNGEEEKVANLVQQALDQGSDSSLCRADRGRRLRPRRSICRGQDTGTDRVDLTLRRRYSSQQQNFRKEGVETRHISSAQNNMVIVVIRC